ncbi:MAG: TonB-dependent hemoglobin/transferrin/lactoferrin family receptor, partial [Delftia acidovorans]|nr:TonB-dependent hemoglobin/transferrin/lactoferrin family receptor [Delftia acidovorans]
MAVSSRSSFLSLSRNPSRTPVLRPSLLAVAVQAAVIGLASPGAWAQTQTQTQTHVQTADDEARLMAQAPTKALAQVDVVDAAEPVQRTPGASTTVSG